MQESQSATLDLTIFKIERICKSFFAITLEDGHDDDDRDDVDGDGKAIGNVMVMVMVMMMVKLMTKSLSPYLLV